MRSPLARSITLRASSRERSARTSANRATARSSVGGTSSARRGLPSQAITPAARARASSASSR